MTGVLLLVGAAVLLIFGAELFAGHAVGAARRLGISLFAVGILLAGAEPEELVTAVIAAAREHPDLAAGDAIGANVTMLTLLLGLLALLRPPPFGPKVRQYAVFAAVLGVLAFVALLGNDIGRLGGAVLVAAYAGFVGLTWARERGAPHIGELTESLEAEQGSERPGRALGLLLVGVLLMTAGGELAVEGAVRVVESLGTADSAVGLTLLALATTAELFALVWASLRRDVDELAVAGVLGSVAYNATATLGAAALTRPLAVSGIVPAAGAAAALPIGLLVLSRGGRLSRPTGVVLLAGYAVFVVLAFR